MDNDPVGAVDPEGLRPPSEFQVPGTNLRFPVVPHPPDPPAAIEHTHRTILAMAKRPGSSFYGLKMLEGPNPKSNCFGEAFLRTGILPKSASQAPCYSISGTDGLDDEIAKLLKVGKVVEVGRNQARRGDLIVYTPRGQMDHAGDNGRRQQGRFSGNVKVGGLGSLQP